MAQNETNAEFVVKGYNSTTISCGEKSQLAAVVNEQEKRSAYIYTQSLEPLDVGSVWSAKGLHWLITEEIIVIKHVHWHKYVAQLCNVELENTWGRFIGPKDKYVNVALKEETIVDSMQKPLIILPSGLLHFGDKIVISGRPWLVQEYDSISTPGVSYYSLAPTTVSKTETANHTEDCFIVKRNDTPYDRNEEPVEKEDFIKVEYNLDITLPTENGYFKYDNNALLVKKRSATSVTFCLPFGVNQVTVETKQDGEVITNIYRKAD